MSDTLLILIIVVVAGLIQGISGFGFGLFSMGLLIAIMPVRDAIGLVSVLGFVSTVVNILSVRKELRWHEAWPVVAAAIPGTAAGVALVHLLDADTLSAGVAVAILLGCVVALWSPGKTRIHKTMPWAPISGLAGGLIGGAVNMGGPPVVLYTLLRGWDKSLAKGVMSSYFVVSSAIRVGLHLSTGVINRELGIQALWLCLPAIGASILGTLIFRRISTRIFRYGALALLVALALRVFLV